MSRVRMVWSGAAAAALALVGVISMGATASAQTAAPFTAYGSGVEAGAEVEAFVGGRTCGSTTADASGQWTLQIATSDPCRPRAGDTITFRLDGQRTNGSATFAAGGAPEDVASGIPLAVVSGGVTFSGDLGPGINLVVFSGGSIEEASEEAPDATAFYASKGGRLIGYIVGAPSFVNGAFFAAFPGGNVSAGPMVVIVAD